MGWGLVLWLCLSLLLPLSSLCWEVDMPSFPHGLSQRPSRWPMARDILFDATVASRLLHLFLAGMCCTLNENVRLSRSQIDQV